ncbi:glycosyltransferase family 4 protein [Vibrio harveyi]|uniref:glycosyltransferase family 4 protein n=1 Tax=Vibrio harveyi TaxID=669 RepID=UPI0009382AD0|nr:glycosyltransferase family 4 protein [Vibrio harveyi]APP06378.1 hypothetical protein BG259_14165 [Vibrio harveyi]
MRKYSIDFFGFSTSKGGAAIAATRIFKAIKKLTYARFFCMDISSNACEDIYNPPKVSWVINFSFRLIEFFLLKIIYPRSPVKVSLNIFGSPWIKRKLIESDSDFVYIQWINNNTISLGGLKRIIQGDKRTIIHLHDEWMLNGVFHISPNILNYTPSFIGEYIDGFFLAKKRKMLKTAINTSFIVPSNFLKERFIEKLDIKRENIYVVPNPLPIDFFSQKDTIEESISDGNLKVLLPSFCPKKNPNKSTDKAIASIEFYAKANLHLMVEVISFGDYDHGEFLAPNIRHTHLGYVGHQELIEAIDASHITLVLSKFETFGQVAAESMARGTPVIARSDTAISELVTHKSDGFLIEKSDVEAVAAAIDWFKTNKHYKAIRFKSRANMEARLNMTTFESLYCKLLNEFYYER